jgi:hypothetical protein
MEWMTDRSKPNGKYLKSCSGLHNSEMVCKLANMMTSGSECAGRPTFPLYENGHPARIEFATTELLRVVFQAVAMARVGKPPRIPARLWQLYVGGRARSDMPCRLASRTSGSALTSASAPF